MRLESRRTKSGCCDSSSGRRRWLQGARGCGRILQRVRVVGFPTEARTGAPRRAEVICSWKTMRRGAPWATRATGIGTSSRAERVRTGTDRSGPLGMQNMDTEQTAKMRWALLARRVVRRVARLRMRQIGRDTTAWLCLITLKGATTWQFHRA